MPSQPSHRDLVVWQRADDLFIRLHLLARKKFPSEERYCLTAQLRRAALSVPANIVEGTARAHAAETLQFLRIAWSSLQEAGYYVHVANRLGYVDAQVKDELEEEFRAVAAPLRGLIQFYEPASAKKPSTDGLMDQ